MAQEPVKQKEIGLIFSNLDNFGITYKTGTEKSLWRFNALFISGYNMDNVADSSANKQNSMGFGIKLGKEYRKVIVNNLELRYGADISFDYSHLKTDYDDKTVDDYDRLNERTTYSSGINLVLGLNYVLSKNLIIGVELLPDFSYTTGTSIEKHYYTNSADSELKTDISGFSYGFSNTSALLSVSYRF